MPQLGRPSEPARILPFAAETPVGRHAQPSETESPLFACPSISLNGAVDGNMYNDFQTQLHSRSGDGLLLVALTTLGGDPEIARAMAEELRLLREAENRRIVFLGKSAIYAAGVILMASFPRRDRFLTHGTRVVIQEHKLDRAVKFQGPLSACLPMAKALLNEIENGRQIERESFEQLIEGSELTLDTLIMRAKDHWYLSANEALDLKLVRGLV